MFTRGLGYGAPNFYLTLRTVIPLKVFIHRERANFDRKCLPVDKIAFLIPILVLRSRVLVGKCALIEC